MEAKRLDNLSIEAYIAIEQEQDTRYEYHDGAIYAMAGGTFNHGRIIGNVFGELDRRLLDSESPCFPLNDSIKLHIQAANRFLYPDVMAVCQDVIMSEVYSEAITNPTLIVEVLSKSTALYDRGDKFYFYRQIPTLKEYVLIEQDKAQVEVYYQQARLWEINRFSGLEESLRLDSLDMDIPMASIYRNVTFPPLTKS